MSFYRSSKKLNDAEKLQTDYQSYFGGENYSSENSKFSDILKITLLSKCRLFILFGVCFMFTIFLLYKLKPRWILQQRKSYDDQDKISVYYLMSYSIFISLFLFIVLSILAYRYPKTKELLYISDDCDLCQA